ncbi:MAG: hypothetical protein NDJ89_17665 [Oligoflexia bacterium]|nr:hypothetical protein [Oligoflexia bacterium]
MSLSRLSFSRASLPPLLSSCLCILTPGGLSGCGWATNNGSVLGFASFTSENSAGTTGIGNAQFNSNPEKGNSLAQSFQLSSENKLGRVSLKLGVSGNTSTLANHTLTLTIEKSRSSLEAYPNGSAFDANATLTLPISQLQTSAQYVTFVLPAQVTLDKDTVYWIRLEASYPVPSNSFVTWAGYSGDSVNGYSQGTALYETIGGTWTNNLLGTFTDLTFVLEN